ncbi:hypothetical protein [Kribbella deserti]|uniref:Phosphodiesterase n=1 Tax=Kribbella deserti TaxID=1926257 RepID=A0ABV6QHD3_9ACTN
MPSVFKNLARLRRGPVLHPDGRTFTAEVELTGLDELGLPRGRYDALVRLSKGGGTPGGYPDVLGLAIRLSLPSGGLCDVLLSSCGMGRLTRLLPWPALNWGSARYGTVMPYDVAGQRFWLVAIPAGPDARNASTADLPAEAPRAFTLRLAGISCEWIAVGELVLGEAVTTEAELVFDPMVNHPPAATLSPRWLRTIRERAYRGSRRGRPGPTDLNTLPTRTVRG